MTDAPSPLTPELCRTFVALVRLDGSVTRTAHELGLNPASVSKRISPLTKGSPPHLPRPWLEKRGKRFYLTDEGKKVLPTAAEQADRWDRFTAFAATSRPAGLTVACGQEAAGESVLRAAAALRRSHPESSFRLAVVRGRRRIEGVTSGLYDVALVTVPKPDVQEIARREVVVTSLPDDEIVLACAAKSAWATAFAADRPAAASELVGWPLVLPEADAAVRRQFDEKLRRQASRPPTIAVEAGGWRVLAGWVREGFGVGLLPRRLATTSRLLVRELDPKLRPSNRLQVVRLPNVGELAEAFCRALEEAGP